MPRVTTIVANRRISASAAVAISALLLSLTPAPTLAVGGSQFVSLANVDRAAVRLAPVALSSPVDQVAVERGNQMARADVLAHDLTYVTTRFGQLGVCWTGVGEIIAWEKGYATHSYQRTIDQWWASPGHHAIMVGNYNVAGGSWSVSASGATYSVMVFLKTCATTTAPANPPPTIVSRTPGSWATGVPVTNGVTVGFSEQVRGVSGLTFVLRDAATSGILPATVTYSSTTRQAVLRPAAWLGLGRSYRVALSSSITDTAGASLAFTTWSFTAATSQVFSPSRTVAFSAGTHVGYKFGTGGVVLATRSYSLAASSSASTTSRALITSHTGTWYYVTNGVWAGHWLQASSGVVLH